MPDPCSQLVYGNTGEERTPELHDAFNDFICRFQHQEFLTGRQDNHGIWSHFNVLNEIRVDDQRHVIESRQMDHIPLFGRKRSAITRQCMPRASGGWRSNCSYAER